MDNTFWQRVKAWRSMQPWAQLIENNPKNSPEWKEGMRLRAIAYEEFQKSTAIAADREQAEARQAAERAAFLARCVAAGIGERYQTALEAPQSTRALTHIRTWLGTETSILVTAGGIGVGKTVAACFACYETRGRLVKATTLREALFDPEPWGELARTPAVVAIDDLGSETIDEKGYWVSRLADFLDSRYRSKAKTLITTNLLKDRFVELYCKADGGRLYDRIRDAGRFVQIPGESMRGRQ